MKDDFDVLKKRFVYNEEYQSVERKKEREREGETKERREKEKEKKKKRTKQ